MEMDFFEDYLFLLKLDIKNSVLDYIDTNIWTRVSRSKNEWRKATLKNICRCPTGSVGGSVHRSPRIYLTAEENPGKPQLGDRLMKVCE